MPTPVVMHPEFGVADSERGIDMWTNTYGRTYVGGYWGEWRIYANLDAREIIVCDEPASADEPAGHSGSSVVEPPAQATP